MTPTRDINIEAKKWAKKNGLSGASVLNRYILFLFLDSISQLSNDFVFKGANLLWHYIKTPRATVDLDFVTLTQRSRDEVLPIIEAACLAEKDIEFRVLSTSELGTGDKVGSRFNIVFQSKNYKGKFHVDVMYALPTDMMKIKSSINSKLTINAASIEEIISDKVKAFYDKKEKNSRAKDIDDLIRISRSEIDINEKKLKELFQEKSIEFYIDYDWIEVLMEVAWEAHVKRYNDLPKDTNEAIKEINTWLKKTKSIGM